MKAYCPVCKIHTADISAGIVRKRAVIMCRECYDRLAIMDSTVKQSVRDTPDFLKGIFFK